MNNKKFHYLGKRLTKRMKLGPKLTTDKQEKRRIYLRTKYGVE